LRTGAVPWIKGPHITFGAFATKVCVKVSISLPCHWPCVRPRDETRKTRNRLLNSMLAILQKCADAFQLGFRPVDVRGTARGWLTYVPGSTYLRCNSLSVYRTKNYFWQTL